MQKPTYVSVVGRPGIVRCVESGCVMSEAETFMHDFALASKARAHSELETPRTAAALVTAQQEVILEQRAALTDVLAEVRQLRAELAKEKGRAVVIPDAPAGG